MPGFMLNSKGSGASANVVPYYKYTWRISEVVGKTVGQRPPQANLPLIYAKEATRPKMSFATTDAKGGSLKYKFPDEVVWEDVKITWYDTKGLAEIFKAWRESIWTPDDGFKLANDYMARSTIESLTYDWRNPVRWTMYNSWPKAVVPSDLTYTDSDISVIDLTLSYDWAEEFFA